MVAIQIFRFMMYGFGDDPCPYTQSIALIEDIVLNYINEITLRYAMTGQVLAGSSYNIVKSSNYFKKCCALCMAFFPNHPSFSVSFVSRLVLKIFTNANTVQWFTIINKRSR